MHYNHFMHKGLIWTVGVIALAALAAYIFFIYEAKGSNALGSPREVTWLLSHQPTDVFENAAEVFADTLQKESGGTLALTIVSPEDVGVTKGDVPHAKVIELLGSGAADIASVYTIPLGKDYADFRALNLPFLFASYEEANTALDGAALPILESLDGNVRGLAFTMSGGFRIIASKNTDVETLEDISGKRIATSGGTIAEATLRALGAVPVSMDLETGNSRDFGTIDGVETTYARLSSALGGTSAYTAHINETNHSVFLTAVIAGGTFYDSLTPLEQAALRKAAIAAASVERNDSVALNASVKESLKKEGSTVTELSPAAREAFVKATASVYAQFKTDFTESIYSALAGQR